MGRMDRGIGGGAMGDIVLTKEQIAEWRDMICNRPAPITFEEWCEKVYFAPPLRLPKVDYKKIMHRISRRLA